MYGDCLNCWEMDHELSTSCGGELFARDRFVYEGHTGTRDHPIDIQTHRELRERSEELWWTTVEEQCQEAPRLRAEELWRPTRED